MVVSGGPRPAVPVFVDSLTTCTPTISSVVIDPTGSTPIITIRGSGFGINPDLVATGDGTAGYDSPELLISDSRGWNAMQPGDFVGGQVIEWTDQRIVLSTGADYNLPGTGWYVDPSDAASVTVVNPQTGASTTATAEI